MIDPIDEMARQHFRASVKTDRDRDLKRAADAAERLEQMMVEQRRSRNRLIWGIAVIGMIAFALWCYSRIEERRMAEAKERIEMQMDLEDKIQRAKRGY